MRAEESKNKDKNPERSHCPIGIDRHTGLLMCQVGYARPHRKSSTRPELEVARYFTFVPCFAVRYEPSWRILGSLHGGELRQVVGALASATSTLSGLR